MIGHDDEAGEVLLRVHDLTDQAQLLDILPIASGTEGHEAVREHALPGRTGSGGRRRM